MKRHLTLRLRTSGCAAEASLNGMSLARMSTPGGSTTLPVHEYLLRGVNRLALRVDPGSVAQAEASTPIDAVLELRLASIGDTAAAPSGDTSGGVGDRVLARADWTRQATFDIDVDVTLPIAFPRWRWLDVPPLPPTSLVAARARALHCVQQRVLEFRGGGADGWFALTRLAFEERGLAYGGDVRAAQAAFLNTLRAAPDGRPWLWAWPTDEDLVLRPEAEGRLLSCLRRAGGPALQARSRDGRHAWTLPLRLAWIDERLHGLR